VIKIPTRPRWLAHLVGYTKDPEEIRPGDIVWFAPGEKHWHRAFPNTAMIHIAIAETLDGKAVDWLDNVSDAQYGA
jgi:quercetin dioxygenase-like cupin family protein